MHHRSEERRVGKDSRSRVRSCRRRRHTRFSRDWSSDVCSSDLEGGLIGLVEDDDIIEIDAVNNTINVKLSDEEIAARRANWKQPALKVSKGVLYKYAKTVANAS